MTSETSTKSSIIYDKLFTYISILIGLYTIFLTLIMVFLCKSPIPFLDQWDDLISGRPITWSYLISQHNEHRLFFPRLVFILDHYLANETNSFDIFFCIAAQFTLSLCIFFLSIETKVTSTTHKIWLFFLILSFLFWSGQWENFTWGYQVQFFGVLLSSFGAFSLLACGGKGYVAFIFVIILEIIAVYTLSNGIITPFISIFLSIWLRRSPIITIILSITAILLLCSYLIGYVTPPLHSNPLDTFRHLRPIAAYAFVELGGPVGLAATAISPIQQIELSAAMGAVGITLLCILAWRVMRHRDEYPPRQVVFLGLAAFVVGTVLLTAAGRVGFGLGQALASRYQTLTVAFWLSLILLAITPPGTTAKTRTAVMLIALPLQLLLGASEPYFVAVARANSTVRNWATPALLANVPDEQLLSGVYKPAPLLPLSRRPLLLSAHTSVFHDEWARWLGTPITEHAALVDARYCRGEFRVAQSVGGGHVPGWRATGWAWLPTMAKPPGRVLFTDAGGVVVGFGLGRQDLRPLLETSPPGAHPNSDWIGAFSGQRPGEVLAFAMLNNDRDACRLGTARTILAPLTPNQTGPSFSAKRS
jgi:hypothetical protein